MYSTFSIYTRACVLLTGSQKERDAVEFANKFSTRREFDIYKADKEDVQFSLQVADDIDIGDSFDVKVVVQNKSNEKRTVKLNITSCLAFYTGMPARGLKQKRETLHLAGKEGSHTLLTRTLGGRGRGAIESVRINGVSVLGGPRIIENVRALFPPGKNQTVPNNEVSVVSRWS